MIKPSSIKIITITNINIHSYNQRIKIFTTLPYKLLVLLLPFVQLALKSHVIPYLILEELFVMLLAFGFFCLLVLEFGGEDVDGCWDSTDYIGNYADDAYHAFD